MFDKGTVTLLDGAMGTALRDRGVRVPDHRRSGWSALSLKEAPHAVVDLHRDYIRAGADVIVTNNYAVTRASLSLNGLEDAVAELSRIACDLAKTAKAKERSNVIVAASLPPLNTSFRSDLVGSHADLLDEYRSLVAVLAPGVDLFICETMTTTVEAAAAAQAGLESGKPVWVGWTLSDDPVHLRGGESLSAAIGALEGLPVSAFLVNCSSVEATRRAIAEAAGGRDVAWGGYANPFRHEPADGQYVRVAPNWLDPEDYAEAALDWVAHGASIIGGCCGTNPKYISAIRQRLKGGVDDRTTR